MKQGNVQNHLNRQRGFITRFSLLVAMISLFVTAGFAQRNYPFPQNYKYPYGNIYTGADVQSKIQSLYNAWKTTYYVAGTMTGGPQSGKPAARIKFQQPGQDGSLTVSEGIAYGMLITVYMDNATNNTQDMFNRLWTYYQGNANGNGFMNWKVNGFTGQVAAGTGNANGATDADVDVANALLMAHKQWGSAGTVNYLTAARTLINAIYTFEVDGNKLLKPGDAFNDYANPCYYITNSTTLFGKVEVDQGWNATDRWQAVNTACYTLMKASRNASTGLVPDWCQTPSGAAINGIINDKFESYFLYDAIRVPWRMAHAYAWYGHADAKDIASKITTWAQTNYPDPATIWDGYLLNGNVFNNPTGNPNFSNLGKNHNPCFSGGLSVGATVDNTFSTYMGKCWSEGSKTDNYGAYYTHTTQLLYMLFLTGNMPNFWDMKPVPLAAETNANGNAIYVDFSKSLSTTTSTTGWTVQTFADETDVTPTAVTVSAISVSDKRVTVTLAADIAEPFIKISYSGTSIKSSADNLVADAFTNFVVTNKITNMEPYPILRMTDVLGTMVKIQWSKEISPASISGGFTVKINGTNAPVGTPTLDPEDATILNIPLSSTLVTSAADVVTVSFAGGSITGTTSSKTAKAFTDAPVQNFYLNVTCYIITDFDANLNASFASWVAGVWSSAGTDPAGGTDKVGYFNGDNTTAYISTKATISAANKPAFGTALYTSGSRLKAKLYAKSGTFATGEQIKIVFAHAALADAGSYYDPNQVQFLITPPSTNAWFEIDLPINGVVDNGYDFIQMTGSNVDKTGNKTNAEFYIDDMQICPAPPTVSVVTGRTSYDGGTIELRFSTAMKVPTSASEISVSVDGLAASVSSITAKQGDATVLVLIMATPISDPNAVITVSGGSSAGLKAVDGRMAEYFYMTPVVNLVGISITTGWRDNFNSSTDYVTANIGVGTAWDTPAPTETATGDGYYKVVGDGSAAWSSIDITTWVDQPDANKEVMDLSGREKVEIRYRIPSATSTTLYLRVDLKDKANGTASDAMAFVPLTISSTWQTKTIDVSAYFVKKYGVTEPIVVDRSNIYQVMFYFIEKEGTSANNYVPTNFKGTIEFDYISIGSALILTVPTTTINEGNNLSATSSATGKIYLVPNNTAPVLTALQDSVFAGKGKVIDVTANVAGSINTTGLKPGYYLAYAYDPTAGAISAKVGVQINDITPPVISPFTSGNVSATGTISATVNEDAMLYLIPASVTNYTVANIIDQAVYQLAVAKDIAASILLSDVNPALAVGTSYKFIAIDYAVTPNVSQSPTTPNINIVDAPLTMTVNPTGTVEQGSPITVGVSRAATAYLIPNSVLISAVADLDANDVSKVTISAASGTLSTVGVPVGEYYVYVSDGITIVGPSAKITIEVSNVPVTNIELLNTSLSLLVGQTKTTEVVFTPTNATNKSLTITSDPTYLTITYNEATRIISVTGVKGAAAPIQVIITSADGPSTTLTVTVTQLPTSITVTPAATNNLKVGGTVQLTADVLPADALNKAVTWTSSNAAVASVNSTGLVTGVAIGGPVTITATSNADGTVVGTATVTVVKTDVASISVDPATVTITLGQSATVTATILPADATNKNLTWTSSAPGVATVTNGVINSVSVGTATITVTSVDNPTVSQTIAVTVNNVAVSSVTVAPTTTSIVVGATASLTATVLPANAPQTVTWTSSAPAIATVSSAGVVTAVAVGTATITATSTADGTKSATCAVTVTPKLVTGISIVPATVTINIGATQALTASVLPNDASNKNVTWSSSAPAIATVDASGVVTGVSAGSATITATAADGSGISGTCAVTVSAIPVATISITPATASIQIGATQVLSASVLPLNATVKTVTWTSSAPAIATVDASGVVTGVSAGTATITATATDGSGVIGTCALTVTTIPVATISILPATVSINIGATQTLTESVSPSNATVKTVTWTSSAPAIATVSATGVVTGVAAGSATITATATDGSGVTGTCAVTVTAIPVATISILPATVSINIGATQTLTESVSPSNATVKTVTWTSSAPAIATVSATGVVTGVAAGSATITATATDGSGVTGTCVVTVNAILPTSVSTSAAIGFVTTDPSQTLVATVLPANATDKSVTWTSSNPSVATVNATTGEVTPVGVGTATITVTCVAAPSVQATCEVTVAASVTPVSGVTVDQPTLTISIGSTGTIVATVAPADATNKSVTWTSSAPAVATVSNGIVSALTVGTTTITVTTVDGSFTATTAVTVSAISVTGVTLDQTTLSLAATSAPVQLVATVAPANATNKAVTWTSSNPAAATISATGIVTVQGIGTTTITVTTTDGNHTATCAVTVSAISATSINLDQTTLTLTPVSAPVQLQATVLPADASDKTVTWTSSAPSVVTVSATGVVTVVGVGTATITAKANGGVGVETTCAVTVNAIPVTSVSLDQASLTLSQTSAPVTLVATINPANATNKNVTWSSSNTSAVTVSQSGVVSPVGLGTSTITVTTVDGAKTAICIVTVSATPVTSITLDQTTLTMTVASTPVQIVATVLPNDASDKSVVWSVLPAGVVTVNASGVVTAVGVGTATITATANDGSGITATCAVTVNAIPVTGVTLDKATMSLVVGGANGSLLATVAPANATNKNVTWSSSAPGVATVVDGVVSPVSAGTATITVTTTDGSHTATCEVTVGTNTIAVSSVSITTPTVTIALNETAQLWAVIQPTNATNTNVTWSSSATGVATVDATGLVTPVSAGTAIITVTTQDGSFTATANITVTNIMTTSITLPNSIAVNVGATEQLTATVLPAGASTSVTWTSSAPAIATVSATGVVTGVAAGTANITATATDGTAKVSNACVVTVSDVVIPVQSVSFSQTTGLTVESGQTLDLGALLVINPSDATIQSTTWSSNLTTAATINASGVVTGQTVALPTLVTITVRVTGTDGVQTSKTVDITVTKPKILVTSITIPSTLSIQEGSTATVSATTITPANADDKTVSWAIISGTGGTINANGQINVTGAVGSTFTVQATANDAGAVKSNQCVVTIVQQVVPVVSIQASTSTVSIEKNENATITLTFNPTNTTQKEVTPEVGTSGVVSVTKISDTEYHITGLKGGTQQVVFRSAATSTVLASVNVSVSEKVESINITAAGSATSVNVSQTVQLTAVVSQSTATNKNVLWTSTDESKATVSATGLVTGIAEGYVYISATAIDGSGVESQFLLNVTKIPVTSISVNPIDEIEITKQIQITSTVLPANATNKGFIYTSSDESVATVDANGVITGVSIGNVTITVASADDLSITQELVISVTPIKANKDLLYTLIENEVFGAYSVYNKVQNGEIVIGFATGQVLPLTYNQFLTAWSEAQDVYWDDNATQEEVDAAVLTLYKAIQAMGVVIPEDEVPISIDDVVVVNAHVYPTKVSSQVTVEASEIVSVAIVGLDGKTVTLVDAQGEASVVVNTESLVQGTYLVKVVTSQGVVVKQIVK